MTAWDQFKQAWREEWQETRNRLLTYFPLWTGFSLFIEMPWPAWQRWSILVLSGVLTALLLRRVRWPGRR